MGLILKDKIKKLQKGYPTRTAKEQTEGGVLGGTVDLLPGEVVCYGAQPGEFTASFDATKIAGIALATNVKLVTTYPGKSLDAPFVPGEAINLMISGYIAVKLVESDFSTTIAGTTPTDAEKAALNAAVEAAIVEGANVDSSDGKVFGLGNTNIENAFLTGVYEITGYTLEGTTYTANVLAEIKYNM